MKFKGLVLILVALFAFVATPCRAADEDENMKAYPTGLPVPRFASLRSDEVNMRTGPGTRYPIVWVYKHKGLPVEILGEFEIWRHVRDADGSEGWVHKSELSGKRAGIVNGTRNLLDNDANNAVVLAHLQNGAVGQILSCSQDWCRLKFEDIKGYLRKSEFWGAYPAETFN